LDVRGDTDGESAMAVMSDERTPTEDGFRGVGRNVPGNVAFNFFSVGSAEC
jgi:hypothetical protein